MLHVRPYLFDREFQEMVEVPSESEVQDLPAEEDALPVPAAPTFSEAELEAACDAARADGERAATAAAERMIATRSARAVEAIADELRSATELAAQAQSAMLRDATAIALTLCRKLLPQTYRDTAAEEIARLLSTVLPRITDQPQVVVRVAGALVATVTEPVTTAVETANFSGSVRVVADDTLAEGDCRIEWCQGGVVRDAATLLREIEAVVDQAVGHLSAADALPLSAPSPTVDDTPEPEPATGAHADAGMADTTELLINPSERADTNA